MTIDEHNLREAAIEEELSGVDEDAYEDEDEAGCEDEADAAESDAEAR